MSEQRARVVNNLIYSMYYTINAQWDRNWSARRRIGDANELLCARVALEVEERAIDECEPAVERRAVARVAVQLLGHRLQLQRKQHVGPAAARAATRPGGRRGRARREQLGAPLVEQCEQLRELIHKRTPVRRALEHSHRLRPARHIAGLSFRARRVARGTIDDAGRIWSDLWGALYITG